MRRCLILAASAALVLGGCIHATRPDAQRQARDASALAAVIPVLDELRVSEWRDDDWCRDFVYRGGHVMTSDDPESCNPIGRPPSHFDAASQADFDRVATALAAAGVPVSEVSRSATSPARITFDLRAGAFDRFSYVHEPDDAPAENLDGEWVATPIDRDWFFVWEDWN